MKIVTIEPVEKPKSFDDVKFTSDEWKAAVKRGPLKVPYGTAQENMKLSKGLYRIRPEVEEVEVKLTGPKQPEDMTKEELVMEMTAWGKPPRKQMTITACREFIAKLRLEAVEMISDDDNEE